MDIIYTFPGDRPTRARLLFGYEFLQQNPKREIRIGVPFSRPSTVIRVGERITCDRCNAEVGAIDPCVLTEGYLYCWACAPKQVLQYAAKGAVALARCLNCGASPCDEEECGDREYACPACDGDGEVDSSGTDHRMECSLCDGTGRFECVLRS